MRHLVVTVPTERTKKRLIEIFMSAPISVDFDHLYVPLWIGDEGGGYPKGFSPQGPYQSKFTSFGRSWSPTHEISELSGNLGSPALKQRALDLGTLDDYPIRLVFLDQAPPLSHTNKSFLVSVSDTLVLKEFEPFTFEKDFLISV